MVSKCINPECSERFMRLHQGKLFCWDGMHSRSNGNRTQIIPKAKRVEFFWLCNQCACGLTVVFKDGIGVTTQALANFDQWVKVDAKARELPDTLPAAHASESAASRQTYAIRHAAG